MCAPHWYSNITPTGQNARMGLLATHIFSLREMLWRDGYGGRISKSIGEEFDLEIGYYYEETLCKLINTTLATQNTHYPGGIKCW